MWALTDDVSVTDAGIIDGDFEDVADFWFAPSTSRH